MLDYTTLADDLAVLLQELTIDAAASTDDPAADSAIIKAQQAQGDLPRAGRGLAWLAGTDPADPLTIYRGLVFVADALSDAVATHDELFLVLGEQIGYVACKSCGDVQPNVSWQTAANDVKHLRAECPECGNWVKWLAQTPYWLRVVEQGGNK